MKRTEMIEIIAQSMYSHNFCDIPDARYLAKLILPDIEKAGMLPPFVEYTGQGFYREYPDGRTGENSWEEDVRQY